MTGYRLLDVPVRRLQWRGGVLFLEQELARCARGGYALMPGASRCERLKRRGRRLRFLFEQRREPESPAGFEFVATHVRLVGRPAGEPHLYAHETTEMLNAYSRYGYEIVEMLEWPGRWLVVQQRRIGQAPVGARYEVMAVPRERVRRDEPAPWPHDRPTIGVLSTQTHLFPVQTVSSERRD